MDLLKAREKAKSKSIDKKTDSDILTTNKIQSDLSKQNAIDLPTKKEAQKIVEEDSSLNKEELVIAQQSKDITVEEKITEIKTSIISKDIKEILEKIFEDLSETHVPDQKMLSPTLPIEEYAQYLVFKIGNEFYGIDLDLVSEIIRSRKASFIPNTPNYVYGLIALRGHMVPIINSHLRLNLTPNPSTNKSRIVIIEINREYMGFTVDEASYVLSIKKSLIKSPPPTLTDIELELITGVYEHKNNLIILINTDNFFKFI